MGRKNIGCGEKGGEEVTVNRDWMKKGKYFEMKEQSEGRRELLMNDKVQTCSSPFYATPRSHPVQQYIYDHTHTPTCYS